MANITPAARAIIGATLAAGAANAQPTFYVSPAGSDQNSGLSRAAPFLTLEKAQSTMQALGTAPATTVLAGGTYQRTQKLDLSHYDDRNKTWIADARQTPILDGSLQTEIAIQVAEPGITVQGLTIQHYRQAGIFAVYADHLLFTHNTIVDITTPDWHSGLLGSPIFMLRVQKSRITYNRILGATNTGIQISGGGAGDNNSDDVVAYNMIVHTCTVVNDCGAIYVRDVGHVSTGQVITGNTIIDFGPAKNLTRGIYLDDEASHVVVSRNLLYGPGTWPIMIHGGNNNVIFNNIFDMSGNYQLGLYQDDVRSGGIDYGMKGNLFTRNIVYASKASTTDLWTYLNQSGQPMGPLRDDHNLYFSLHGTLPNTGAIRDSKPIEADPLFVDAPAHNYQLKTGSPAFALGFKPDQ